MVPFNKGFGQDGQDTGHTPWGHLPDEDGFTALRPETYGMGRKRIAAGRERPRGGAFQEPQIRHTPQGPPPESMPGYESHRRRLKMAGLWNQGWDTMTGPVGQG